ncbi:N-acetylmuramoyl-L-alanine amidase family protein [Actinobacillus capsulatus]|uniref:N-acetylmuramoyl-L-alanine amidase family protein n=1 Tax=Actinobacillus capsulatus TaxID=717 RepID=UPI0003667FB4|nr:N-acetylmuramoyl-L-alanine amidase [Actinobacillus capsulatus]
MNKLVNYIAVSLFGLFFSLSSYAKTVVVIDAGHGGKDPGAIGGTLGVKEKNVTLAISKELKALLDSNPKFKAVMTRKSDYFIQLPERTEIARKNKANLLVSIHADSSPKSNSLKGASVWVLSNRRASDEMGKWLEDHEKQSELLGGAGSVLSNTNEKYLNQTVLDLQFSHSQRSGYELGKTILSHLGNVTSLAKPVPQHASLSVLRSPDITSILVETGFLSNPVEEQKLATPAYCRKIAQAIYNGLVAYISRHSGNTKAVYKEVKETPADTDKNAAKEKKTDRLSEKSSKKENSDKVLKTNKNDNSKTKVEEKLTNDNKKNSKDKESNLTKREPQKSSNGYHIVQQDETLYSIARVYNTTPEKLSNLNNIKNNKITVGKKLKVQ